jgi:hypothetical protein
MSSPFSQNTPFEPVMSQNNLIQTLDPSFNKIRFNSEIENLLLSNKVLWWLKYNLDYIIKVNLKENVHDCVSCI